MIALEHLRAMQKIEDRVSTSKPSLLIGSTSCPDDVAISNPPAAVHPPPPSIPPQFSPSDGYELVLVRLPAQMIRDAAGGAVSFRPGVSDNGGVHVAQIMPGTTVEAASALRQNDVILSIGGVAIETPADIFDQLDSITGEMDIVLSRSKGSQRPTVQAAHGDATTAPKATGEIVGTVPSAQGAISDVDGSMHCERSSTTSISTSVTGVSMCPPARSKGDEVSLHRSPQPLFVLKLTKGWISRRASCNVATRLWRCSL